MLGKKDRATCGVIFPSEVGAVQNTSGMIGPRDHDSRERTNVVTKRRSEGGRIRIVTGEAREPNFRLQPFSSSRAMRFRIDDHLVVAGVLSFLRPLARSARI